jgi:hypothetical protein
VSASFITSGHVRAFQAVTTQLYGEVTLASCRINGEPGVATVLMEHVGEGKVGVMPLFVAITSKMEIVFEGESAGGDGGGVRPTSPGGQHTRMSGGRGRRVPRKECGEDAEYRRASPLDKQTIILRRNLTRKGVKPSRPRRRDPCGALQKILGLSLVEARRSSALIGAGNGAQQ